MKPVGLVLTFLCVSAAIVLFRSSTIASAIDLAKGMMGLNGIALPEPIYAHLGPFASWMHNIGVKSYDQSGKDFTMMIIWVMILAFIALTFPNSLKILARYEPALGVKPRQSQQFGRIIEWNPSVAWAIMVAAISAMGVIFIGGPSEFLYWQF